MAELRRLDDRIRELCSEALSGKDAEELTSTLSELRLALHRRIASLRELAAKALSGRSEPLLERRKASKTDGS